MQSWFYSIEVYENDIMKKKFSGIYPEGNIFLDASPVDYNNATSVMNALTGREKLIDENVIVFFTAFNRV